MSPSNRSEVAVGVDGCPGGWAVVEWSAEGLTAAKVDDLSPLIERLRAGDVGAVAIDMPMGLLDHQPRVCDVEARKLLGPRRSSVFPTPVRATLEAEDYRQACELSRSASGKALSIQAFNLLPKIRQLDRLVRPEDQDRLVEAHPECAFARLAGEPLEPKKTVSGQQARRFLLEAFEPRFGPLLDDRRGLPMLDLIDASVLAITAQRVIGGTEHRLGSEVDRVGLTATVVY